MENQSESEDVEVRDMKISITEEIDETVDGISTLSGDENSNCSIVAESCSNGVKRGRPCGARKKYRRKYTKMERRKIEKQQREERLAQAAVKNKAKSLSRRCEGYLLRNAKLDEEGYFNFDPER